MDQNQTTPLNLKPAADDATKSPSEAAAADKAAADKAAADKAAADKAAEPAKKPRDRRGPPKDGKPENRVLMVLTTSRLSNAKGERLRRGRLVSVPERRVESLVKQGRVRKASVQEVELLKARHGVADLG